jgi:hypothetical protein
MLSRYWFRFEGAARSLPAGLAMGCGVTAATRDEAAALIKSELLGGRELPPIADVIENVDVSKLDSNHVLPNVGPSNVRGVWFPRQ